MATILVVDDEKNIRILYQEELEAEGYKVLTAENADEAIKILDNEKVDVVVLDLRMPGTHGIDALEKMMVKIRDLSVLINTAYSEYRDDFLTWLAEDYILKSADLSVLKDKIKKILEKKGKI
ncbi:response regulator [bacterium]|nr:MAG: response regulator [bacterium]